MKENYLSFSHLLIIDYKDVSKIHLSHVFWLIEEYGYFLKASLFFVMKLYFSQSANHI